MRVHSLLVESVYLRRLGESAAGNDFLGDNFDGCPVASREKKLGPLTRKGTRDSAADPASGSVDHRNPVLEHHLSLFCASPIQRRTARLSRRSSSHHYVDKMGAHLPPSSRRGRCQYEDDRGEPEA